MDTVFRFAIDRGGTFTDVYVEVVKGGVTTAEVHKLLSVDPQNYADAPTEGIRRVLEEKTGVPHPKGEQVDTSRIQWIRMGTTVATNALLEREGERSALVMTKGLRDVLKIGNQSRPNIFDLKVKRPSVLYEEVIELDERVQVIADEKSADGIRAKVLREPDLNALEKDLIRVRDECGIRSLAVALLHSYVYPAHEEAVKTVAERLGFTHVSLSSGLIKMAKLTSRGYTASVDAYLTPKITEYLTSFAKGFKNNLKDVKVEFMQSDGGLCDISQFSGYRGLLSGPAGGVIGYSRTAYGATATDAGPDESSRRPVIGFDMGGTSTDVSRYAGRLEQVFETETAGVTIQAPQLDISTVAAGGGSRLFFRSGLFVVGPESVGAQPGPVCYRKGGNLAVTDANLLLGRIVPEMFPKIFGPNADEGLDVDATRRAFDALTAEVNAFELEQAQSRPGYKPKEYTAEEIAIGFIRVANEAMCRPIRSLTEAKGYEIGAHVLSCFGGAGGQHACAVARSLGIDTVFVHRFCSVLSAYGIGIADTVIDLQEPMLAKYDTPGALDVAASKLTELEGRAKQKLEEQGVPYLSRKAERFLNLRYDGTDFGIMVLQTRDGDDFKSAFVKEYESEHGFTIPKRDIIIDDVRVRVVAVATEGQSDPARTTYNVDSDDKTVLKSKCYFEPDGWLDVDVIKAPLQPGLVLTKPSILLDPKAGVTIVIEPRCTAKVTEHGDVEISIPTQEKKHDDDDSGSVDAVSLSLFSHRFMGIAEQMGRTLQRTAISTNIKERLDFSCAIFDDSGGLVANAPHVPVHLGSMQDAVRYQIRTLGAGWKEKEVILTNHPVAGGSHLPDVTIITPVYSRGKPIFYVASRGHQCDIGGLTPGSMPPFSVQLDEEGLAVMAFKVVTDGLFQEEQLRKMLEEAGSRQINDVVSDLRAQVAANKKGISLVEDLINKEGEGRVQKYMKCIQNTAALCVKSMLRRISHERGLGPVGSLLAEDQMDNGLTVKLRLEIDRGKGTAEFDFTGTDPEVYGNLNAPRSVVTSAVIYSLRCLVDEDIPLNQGCLDPVSIVLEEGSMLLPSATAAVVGGNVLVSQRVTDVILRAFGAAAASQGCMNNFTFGEEKIGYYETIAGGAGAGADWHGASGVHTHMTNTRITDAEILERRYPVLLTKFHLRTDSGGHGEYDGGDGVVREIKMLRPLTVSILSERRVFAPWGLNGGEDGARGCNYLIRKDNRLIFFGGKNTATLEAGESIRICTPGGGGYGTPSKEGKAKRQKLM